MSSFSPSLGFWFHIILIIAIFTWLIIAIIEGIIRFEKKKKMGVKK